MQADGGSFPDLGILAVSGNLRQWEHPKARERHRDMSNSDDWIRKLKTYAVALRLVCQDFADTPEECEELIEMYLSTSRSYLDDPSFDAYVNQTFIEVETIRCGGTNEPD